MRIVNKDTWLGLGLAVFFGILLMCVIPSAVVVPSNIKVSSLRPDFWPIVLCIFLVTCSLLLAVLSFRESADPDTPIRKKKEVSHGKRAVPANVKPFMTIAGLLAYYFAIEPLGIVISSSLVLAMLTFFYGEKRFKIVIPLAVLLPVVLYLFFTKVASVPLPMGYYFQ